MSHKGHKISNEQRKKISSSLKKYYDDPANRLKVSIKSKGRKCSSERKAKISAANKGHIVSAETRAKISAANSKPETKQKISNSLKKYYLEHPEALKKKSEKAKEQWRKYKEQKNII